MEFIVEILLELLINIIGEVLFESIIRLLQAAYQTERSVPPIVAAIGYSFLGLVAGGASLLIVPGHFFPSSQYRGLGLILIPSLAGLAMVGIGMLRSRFGTALIRLDMFTYAFLFAFFMTLIRFLYTR